jgi:hypothetical protein
LNVPTSGNTDPSIAQGDAFIAFYKGSATQYSWLASYSGQDVTLEIALCNWNDKTDWKCCVLAIRLADGTKIMNELNRLTPDTMWYTTIEGLTEPPAAPNPDNPEEQSQQTTESESSEGGENSLLNRISAINEVRYLHLRGCTLIIDGNTLQEQGLKESLKDNPVFESAEIRERREQPNGNLTGFDMIIKLREPIRK